MKIFYLYPNCTTCKRAKIFLEKNNIEFEEKNLKDSILSKEDIINLLGNMSLKSIFNTSGKTYRNLNLKNTFQTLSKEDAIELLHKDSSLIKRPILIDNENKIFLIGFKEKDWEILLK